jgi:hypothetical protein
MSVTSTGDGPWGRDPSHYRPWFAWVLRRTRWVPGMIMWTGHYFPVLVIVLGITILISDAAGRPRWSLWIVYPLLVIWFANMTFGTRFHDAKLCTRCGEATPLDYQGEVEKWKPALRLEHRPWLIFAILAATITFSVAINHLLIIGIRQAGLPPHHYVWAYFLQDIPIIIAIAASYTADWQHRRLYPWCPWCHWGDGGDEEFVPDPDPEDHGVKNPS